MSATGGHTIGTEVDIVVEDGRDGSVVGIEVKSGSRIHPKDRRGVRILGNALRDRLTAGFVLYTSPHSIRYKDADAHIIALPLDCLWTAATPRQANTPTRRARHGARRTPHRLG